MRFMFYSPVETVKHFQLEGAIHHIIYLINCPLTVQINNRFFDIWRSEVPYCFTCQTNFDDIVQTLPFSLLKPQQEPPDIVRQIYLEAADTLVCCVPFHSGHVTKGITSTEWYLHCYLTDSQHFPNGHLQCACPHFVHFALRILFK